MKEEEKGLFVKLCLNSSLTIYEMMRVKAAISEEEEEKKFLLRFSSFSIRQRYL